MPDRYGVPHNRSIPLLCICVFMCCLSASCGRLEVDAVSPERGTIQASFTEQAKTRLEKEYPITMPVSGRIKRITLEPGDRVTEGQEVVPYDLVPLKKAVERARAVIAELKAELAVKDDDRIEKTALKESRAVIEAARQALQASEEQIAAQEARKERAQKHYKRMKALNKTQAVPQSTLDDAVLEAETSLIEYRRQEFYYAALKAILVAIKLGPDYIERYLAREDLERVVILKKLDQARAQLDKAEHRLELASVTSPIDGTVLERHSLGDTSLQAGAPLLLIGNLDHMEVVSDVLTQDALKLKTGGKVILEPAAGFDSIEGKVKRIEPAGFTKLSSLGVEQQRVNVIVAFKGPHEKLGVGYRLQARFFTGSRSDALVVPRFAVMQSPDRSYYVLKIVDAALEKQEVRIGLTNDMHMEILSGLTEKDLIAARPDASMEPGQEVSVVDTSR